MRSFVQDKPGPSYYFSVHPPSRPSVCACERGVERERGRGNVRTVGRAGGSPPYYRPLRPRLTGCLPRTGRGLPSEPTFISEVHFILLTSSVANTPLSHYADGERLPTCQRSLTLEKTSASARFLFSVAPSTVSLAPPASGGRSKGWGWEPDSEPVSRVGAEVDE